MRLHWRETPIKFQELSDWLQTCKSQALSLVSLTNTLDGQIYYTGLDDDVETVNTMETTEEIRQWYEEDGSST